MAPPNFSFSNVQAVDVLLQLTHVEHLCVNNLHLASKMFFPRFKMGLIVISVFVIYNNSLRLL